MGQQSSIPTSNRLQSWPALRIVAAYGCGLILQSLLGISDGVIWVVLLSGLVAYWTAHLWSNRRPSPLLTSIQVVCYSTVILLFGMQRYAMHTTKPPIESGTNWNIATLVDEAVGVEAVVLQVRTRSTGSTVWMRAKHIAHESVPIHLEPVEMLLRWDADAPLPEIGDLIRVRVRFREPMGARNPFEFDYRNWLLDQGIRFQGTVDSLISVKYEPGGTGWLPLRRSIDQLVRASFAPGQIPIAKALLLGQKGDVETVDRQAFARSGLSHLMAVSGLHVGFIIMPIWYLIPFIWMYPVGRHLGFAFMVTILFLYCGITGFPASVVRASVMASLAAFARIYRHPREPINLMSLAALIILFFDPSALWDTGFQLSFSAVTILLTVLPSLQKLLPERFNRKPWSALSGLILVSVVVQVGLYPILASEFGEYSMAGTAANMAGIPLTQILILWSLVGLPLSALLPDASTIIMWPADRAAWLLMRVAAEAGSWDWAWWYVARPSSMIYPTWIAAAMLITGLRGRWRWKLTILFLFSLLGWKVAELRADWSRPEAEVLFFDVGQGDAAFIRTRSGANWLVDTGVFSPGYESGGRTILPVLRRLGVRKLNGVVLSHPHADHVGGTLSILESMPVDTLYEADFPTLSTVVAGYRSAARRHKVPIVFMRDGRTIDISPGVRARVLGPIDPEHHSDPNTASVVLRLEVGDVSFLFTGDADEEAEMLLIDRYAPLLPSTVLKAGHHGSRTSSSIPFMQTVNPDHIVVSLGLQNRYRHPHAEAIARLRISGAEMHFTSLKSAVWMATDGRNVWEVPWK